MPWIAQAVDWVLTGAVAAEREAAAGALAPGAGRRCRGRTALEPGAERLHHGAGAVGGAGRAGDVAPAAVVVLDLAQPVERLLEAAGGAGGAQGDHREGGRVRPAFVGAVVAALGEQLARRGCGRRSRAGRRRRPRARGSCGRGRRGSSSSSDAWRAGSRPASGRRRATSSGLRPAASSPSIAQPVISAPESSLGRGAEAAVAVLHRDSSQSAARLTVGGLGAGRRQRAEREGDEQQGGDAAAAQGAGRAGRAAAAGARRRAPPAPTRSARGSGPASAPSPGRRPARGRRCRPRGRRRRGSPAPRARRSAASDRSPP